MNDSEKMAMRDVIRDQQRVIDAQAADLASSSQEAAQLREALERLLDGAVRNKAGQICVHENAYKDARAALKEGAPNER